MSEGMDGLIEEIQDIYKAGTERRTPNVSPQQLIARIGNAYADGELKLPTEVWRTVAPQGFQLWAEDERWLNLRKGDILIVLREEPE